jgi:hypothetical protein
MLDQPKPPVAPARPSRASAWFAFFVGMIVGAIALFMLGVYLTR